MHSVEDLKSFILERKTVTTATNVINRQNSNILCLLTAYCSHLHERSLGLGFLLLIICLADSYRDYLAEGLDNSIESSSAKPFFKLNTIFYIFFLLRVKNTARGKSYVPLKAILYMIYIWFIFIVLFSRQYMCYKYKTGNFEKRIIYF